MKAAGAAVGIDFTGKCDRYPNTLIGHALLEYAKNFEDGKYQNDVQEALFQVRFKLVSHFWLAFEDNGVLSFSSKLAIDLLVLCRRISRMACIPTRRTFWISPRRLVSSEASATNSCRTRKMWSKLHRRLALGPNRASVVSFSSLSRKI